MTPVTSQNSRFTELDGVRGIAILLTIACNTVAVEQSSLLGKLWYKAADGGWIGVQLFFVLSGFLITEILLETKGGTHYLRNFYARRALRILPAYIVLLLIVTAITKANGESMPIRAACHWLFLTNVCIAKVNHWIPYLGPIWSLAVEEHFYLFWPLVVLLLGTRSLFRVALLIIGLSLVLRLVLTLIDAPGIALYVLTPTRIDGLAAGAVIALALREPAWQAVLKPAARVLFLGGLVTMIVVALWTGAFVYHDPLVQTLGYAGLTAAGSGLVLGLVSERNSGWIGRRVFRTPWLASVGFYSYAMYLFHGLVQLALLHIPGFAAIAGGGHRDISLGEQLVLVVSVTIVTYLAALVSFHAIEKHFLSLRRYVGRSGEPLAPAAQRT